MVVMQTYTKFTNKKNESVITMLHNMDFEEANAIRNVDSPKYAQEVMQNPIQSLLHFSMVKLFKDSMRKAIKQ